MHVENIVLPNLSSSEFVETISQHIV